MKKISYVSILSLLLLLGSFSITNAQITFTFSFSVGTVGLAAGTNLGVNVLTQTGGALFFAINNGRSWPAGSIQTAQRTLPAKITLNQITGIEIVTAPQSPLTTGSWDLLDFQVIATTTTGSVSLISISGKSYVKFRPNQLKKLYTVNLPVPPQSASQSLMLDADFSRPEIPLGPVDRPTPPQYVEPQDYPGKPIPGTLTGDLYSFQTGNAAEFIVVTDPTATNGNRFLRLPHLPVLSMMNLICRRFSSTEFSRRQIQARLVFVARDLMHEEATFLLNDPAEIFSGGLSDGIPNGILRLRFQNGQIWAKTEGSTSIQLQVGTFRPNVRTEITIKLLLRPNAVVEVVVSANGTLPTVDRTVRIPAQSFLSIGQVGRLAWHIMPPVYQQRPTPLQEFRLFGAYIQSY